MTQYEIYWSDLTPEAQERLSELKDDNVDLSPLAIIDVENVDTIEEIYDELGVPKEDIFKPSKNADIHNKFAKFFSVVNSGKWDISIPLKIVKSIKDELITDEYIKFREYVLNTTLHDVTTTLHHSIGMTIRNQYKLWTEEGELNKWFLSHNIKHGDDKSTILLTLLYQNVNNIPYDLTETIKNINDHWKKLNLNDYIIND